MVLRRIKSDKGFNVVSSLEDDDDLDCDDQSQNSTVFLSRIRQHPSASCSLHEAEAIANLLSKPFLT